MKSGGPWNLRGLRPAAREAARDAARRSGVSVGEWLNTVIESDEDEYEEPARPADQGVDSWEQDDQRRGRDREARDEDREPRRQRDRDKRDRGRGRDHRFKQRDAAPEATGERERADRDRERECDTRERGRGDQDRERERDTRERERGHDIARERERADRERERDREMARELEATRERQRKHEAAGAVARQQFSELNTRLDRLTQQLDRMTQRDAARQSAPRQTSKANEAPQLTGAPFQPRRGSPAATPRPRPLNGAAAEHGAISVDDAIAEIAERQRVLYGETAATAAPKPQNAGIAAPAATVATPAPSQSPAPQTVSATLASPVEPAPATNPASAASPALPAAEIMAITAAQSTPVLDIAGLERQLREITARIETLRPNNDIERVIQTVRGELADIGRQLTEALPRHALESLEIEVQALAKRIDHSRESGVEAGTLTGLERGLSEVRDALRGLTPAENLVGFDEAVRALAQKVDLIVAKEDPAALEQLETAIGALRGIVSHVASNDTLTKVAEDVRALAARVDTFANSAASGQAVLQLENRIERLANALNASTEAGHAVPRDLEKLLTGLIEKLEWVQLTHTDHAALGHLEDRIAQLIKRFDASEARFGNLEAIERGMADLLVHLDKPRGDGTAEPSVKMKLGAPDAIEREVAEIKRSERHTEDSLEAVHGAVEHVVDRLAKIESDMHREAAPQPPAAEDKPAPAVDLAPVPAPSAAASELSAQRTAMTRTPIDPNLPPDHPLEPGTTSGARTPSAADRIAASEAAFGAARPPVISEPGEKPNFIAAARRAAQTAASSSYERVPKAEVTAAGTPAAGRPSRLRKMIVAGGAVLIAVGCLHIASRMFQEGGVAIRPQGSERVSPPAGPPDSGKTQDQSTHPGPLVLPIPQAAPDEPPANALEPPATVAPPAMPAAPAGRQSALPDRAGALWAVPDVTGSVARAPATPAPPQPAAVPPATSANSPASDKLPATIGGPALRAAAMAGDASAEFEIAMRFADGRGVPPNMEQATRWLDRAGKQGLAPAQFKLGGFYEKGIGAKKDLAMARDLYRAAADKGNGKATHNLAVLYAEGINGPADYRSAAHWFRKAADYGITDSQYNLAILYARGAGVDQNYGESYRWFALAANAGDADAAKKRDEVALHLDPQSLAAAQAAVKKWTAEPQPDDAINVKTPPGGWDAPANAVQSAKPKAHSAGTKAAAEPAVN